jgi:hypothetical protein
VKKAICFALITLAAGVGTWTLGWFAVPIVALAAGLLGCPALLTAAASATAWLAILAIDAVAGSVPRVASVLAGVMGLPAIVVFALTLVLPALLGWSAASIGDAARSLRPISRRPS